MKKDISKKLVIHYAELQVDKSGRENSICTYIYDRECSRDAHYMLCHIL